MMSKVKELLLPSVIERSFNLERAYPLQRSPAGVSSVHVHGHTADGNLTGQC